MKSAKQFVEAGSESAFLLASKEPVEFNLKSFEQIMDAPPAEWRIHNVLPQNGIAAIYGQSGAGKSFFAIDMLVAIADGRPWMAHRTAKTAVVYVALEGIAGLSKRLRAYRKIHGSQAGSQLSFVTEVFRLNSAADVVKLATLINRTYGPGAVVCIDTLNLASPGSDENCNVDVGQLIKALKLLQSLIEGLVIFVHHVGKDASRGMRMHSSMFGALDAVLEVTRDDNIHMWKTQKVKDGDDGQFGCFELTVVPIGHDRDGDAITSCVVSPCEWHDSNKGPNGGGGRPRGQQFAVEAFAAACRKMLGDQEPSLKAISLEDWRDAYLRVCTSPSANSKQKAFTRAVVALVEQKLVRGENEVFEIVDVGLQAEVMAMIKVAAENT